MPIETIIALTSTITIVTTIGMIFFQIYALQGPAFCYETDWLGICTFLMLLGLLTGFKIQLPLKLLKLEAGILIGYGYIFGAIIAFIIIPSAIYSLKLKLLEKNKTIL